MTDFFASFSTSTFLASIAGSGATALFVVKWFSGHIADRWLAKYKSGLDKEFEAYRDRLEQKRKQLEAQLSHRVYTTQTQFDTEFTAIKEIFAALGKMRLSFNGMRPFLDHTPDDPEQRTKEIARRLLHLSERYNTCVDTAQSAYPFVPEDIYEEVDKCLMAALIEINHVREAGAEALSYSGYSDGAKQLDKFNNAYFVAAKLVRERFTRLSVVSNY